MESITIVLPGLDKKCGLGGVKTDETVRGLLTTSLDRVCESPRNPSSVYVYGIDKIYSVKTTVRPRVNRLDFLHYTQDEGLVVNLKRIIILLTKVQRQ